MPLFVTRFYAPGARAASAERMLKRLTELPEIAGDIGPDAAAPGEYVYAIAETPDAVRAKALFATLAFGGRMADHPEGDHDPGLLSSARTGAFFGFYSDHDDGRPEPDMPAGVSWQSSAYHLVDVGLTFGPEGLGAGLDGQEEVAAPMPEGVRTIMDLVMPGGVGDILRSMSVLVEAQDEAVAKDLGLSAAPLLYLGPSGEGIDYPYRSVLPVVGTSLISMEKLRIRSDGLLLCAFDFQGLGGPATD